MVVGGRRGELVTVPVLGRMWLELVGAVTWEEIEGSCFALLRAKGLELTDQTAEIFELSKARRTLAAAARDPDNHAAPFGTVEEWSSLDVPVLNAAWHVYGDVRERLDPHAGVLTDNERSLLEVAVKKKDEELLRTFGTAKLSAWLCSTDVLPSISPSPSSSSSESPPEV